LVFGKLRLSALVFCVLGCFFGLGLEGLCGLRLCYGRIATFNVDPMLMLLPVMGAVVFSVAGSVLLGFRFSNFWDLTALSVAAFSWVAGGGAFKREKSSIKRKAKRSKAGEPCGKTKIPPDQTW
jgi:hypothetical protein